MSWQTDVPVRVDETRPGTPEVRELGISPAVPDNPAAATLVLGARNAQGDWIPQVEIPPLRLIDDAGGAKNGQDFEDVVLTARIDGEGKLAKQFNIPDGTLLADALPQIGWGFLYPTTKITKTKKGK